MNALADYSHLMDIPSVLQHYLKMVVEDKPDDVVSYLLEKIESDPWKPKEEEEGTEEKKD